MDAKKDIRVAYYTDAPHTGGAEKYLMLLADHVRGKGFDPVVIFDEGCGAEKLKGWLEARLIPMERIERSGGGSWRSFRRLAVILKDLAPDIFHINLPGPFDGRYGMVAVAARTAGIRSCVTTEHLPMFPSFPKSRLLKGFSAPWIDRVITVSRDNRRHLMEKHGISSKRIRVIYNGIPDPGIKIESLESKIREAGNDLNILAAGSLEERKGGKEALEVIRRLGGKHILHIAGTGPLEKELVDFSRREGLDDRIDFMGYREDLLDVMRDMDLLLHPSRIDATPYVIMEAMALGIPVIASDIFGIPEMIDHMKTGILVEPGDTDGMVSAIEMIAGHLELRFKMSKSARNKYTEKFTIGKSAGETVRVYREVLGLDKRGGRS